MCGIIGAFNKSNDSIFLNKFNVATKLLSHRGPDNLTTIKIKNNYLGHTRLSIIDLREEANQPFTESGKFYLVFNGEIFNYLEIKRTLKSKGIAFRTNSDTEVVLKSYLYWGKECLNKFNGMWAFYIYNVAENSIFAARDRFGIKPFYYFHSQTELLIASEIKSIIKMDASFEINYQEVSKFLNGWGCDSSSDSIFKGIKTLLPGHYLEWSENHFNVHKWWDLQANKVALPNDYRSKKEYFLELFENSVNIRMRSDVDVGICLSGGIDSSSIYGMAKKIQASDSKSIDRLEAYSIVYPGSPIDESPWINDCLAMWGDQGKKFTPNVDNYIDLLDKIIWTQEAPVWSPAVFALYSLYESISNSGVKVILEGHGVDETIGGYPYMVEEAIRSFGSRYEFRNVIKSVNCLNNTLNANTGEKASEKFKKFITAFPPVRKLRGLKNLFKKSSKQDNIFIKDDLEFLWKIKEDYNSNLTTLDNCLSEAFHDRILPIVLRVFDRATMCYGIESRSPYLDYRLVSFFFSLNDSDKIQDYTKKIIRDSISGFTPNSVIQRTNKMGFALDIKHWFSNQRFLDYLLDHFKSVKVRNSRIVDSMHICKELEKFRSGSVNFRSTNKIWEAINLSLWETRFFNS